MRTLKIRMTAAILALVFASLAPAVRCATDLRAQSKASSAAAPPAKLAENERRGEGLFLQRCSICHLPRKLKFGSPPVIGPSLSGQFKDAGPEQMKVLRGFILKGGPDMPGFQYGLEPDEVDELIAYLKTI